MVNLYFMTIVYSGFVALSIQNWEILFFYIKVNALTRWACKVKFEGLYADIKIYANRQPRIPLTRQAAPSPLSGATLVRAVFHLLSEKILPTLAPLCKGSCLRQQAEGLYAYIKIYAYCQPTTPLSRHSRDISPYTGAILVRTI